MRCSDRAPQEPTTLRLIQRRAFLAERFAETLARFAGLPLAAASFGLAAVFALAALCPGGMAAAVALAAAWLGAGCPAGHWT
jgi:hypothetical protein